MRRPRRQHFSKAYTLETCYRRVAWTLTPELRTQPAILDVLTSRQRNAALYLGWKPRDELKDIGGQDRLPTWV